MRQAGRALIFVVLTALPTFSQGLVPKFPTYKSDSIEIAWPDLARLELSRLLNIFQLPCPTRAQVLSTYFADQKADHVEYVDTADAYACANSLWHKYSVDDFSFTQNGDQVTIELKDGIGNSAPETSGPPKAGSRSFAVSFANKEPTILNLKDVWELLK